MLIECTSCLLPLTEDVVKSALPVCPRCGAHITFRLFPALLRPNTALTPQDLTVQEGEASCYNHLSKKAVTSCSRCGRFLCALCEVQIGGETWCPACLALQSAVPQKVISLENHRTLFDSIALATATLPAILIYPAFLSAPLSLFLSIRYWNRPSSLVPRSKWRFIVAILLALVELIGLVFLIFGLAAAMKGVRGDGR